MPRKNRKVFVALDRIRTWPLCRPFSHWKSIRCASCCVTCTRRVCAHTDHEAQNTQKKCCRKALRSLSSDTNIKNTSNSSSNNPNNSTNEQQQQRQQQQQQQQHQIQHHHHHHQQQLQQRNKITTARLVALPKTNARAFYPFSSRFAPTSPGNLSLIHI